MSQRGHCQRRYERSTITGDSVSYQEVCHSQEWKNKVAMSKKRIKRRRSLSRSGRPSAGRRAPPGGIRLTTAEGDEIVVATARYRHTAPEDILLILRQADDFGLDEAEPDPDGTFHFPWYEMRPDASPLFAPIGRRVLAYLTLTPVALEVEAPSRRRLDDCRRRLEQLLGNRIRLVETKVQDAAEALRARKPRAEPEEPFVPPPEFVAEIEEKMLRQWIDDSIPALGGLTPREAVKTPEGRRQVLALIEDSVEMQERVARTPGMFAPDYRKVKKMLGLE
jgi:hypothetical protein